MSLVVDASVAVKWVLAEDDSETAHRLAESGEALHAPRLLASEVANAVWSRVRRGELERGQATELVATVPEMPLRWHTDESICTDAIRLALTYDRAVYDCMYLALAQRIGACLVTADRRFADALSQTEHADVVATLTSWPRAE